MEELHEAWPFIPIGALDPADRGRYYDELSEYVKVADPEVAALFGWGNSDGWESQHFRIGILDRSTNRFQNADGYPCKPLRNGKVHVYMARFFAAAMPGRRFQLQLFLGSQHQFDDNKEPQVFGHSYAVDGIVGDYVNLLNEPVFRNLQVAELLKLRIGVNFMVNKTTQKYAALLKSDVLTRGIELTRNYNPVFGSALAYIRGVTTAILDAKGNKPIISHDVTFTADPSPTVPTLCDGTYLFLQIPQPKLDSLDWTRLCWDPNTSRVLEAGHPLDWNHLILRLQAV